MIKVPVVENPPPATKLPHEGDEEGGGTGVPGATTDVKVDESMPEEKEEPEDAGGATASTDPQAEEQEPLTGASCAKP
eukprot:4576182-Prorocentrum_lima.AAC.1